MILRTNEIQLEDVRHLHCSDPLLKKEVARTGRSWHRPISSVPTVPTLRSAGQVPTQTPRPAA